MPWTLEDVGGHPCDIFEPRERHPQGFVVMYLHGVHEQTLADHEPFTEQFERHGLVVVRPPYATKLVVKSYLYRV